MFDDDKVPQNLPTEGKSMLDNINPDTKEPPKPPAAPAIKIASAPPVAAPAAAALKAPMAPAVKTASAPPAESVDDIFSNVKEPPPVASSLASPQKTSLPGVPPARRTETASVETPRQGFKKILIIAVIIIIFAGVLGFGGYWIYNNLIKPKPLSPNLNINTPPPEEAQPVETPAPEITVPVPVDSDNDGLIDSEEVRLGTDALNPDTDGDRLFDGEEVNVYLTDPLNKDTDGDGFEDGSEVQNGYDPKGPGKLIRIPAGQ